jgi:2-(1,2-epoxy-1,2-dihydrophenyl)acetyl-CoA isomerase
VIQRPTPDLAVLRPATPTLTAATRDGLRADLDVVAGDRSVHAVVLAAPLGSRQFCLGQDLTEHAAALAADPDTAVDSLDREYRPLVTTLLALPKPVVAAVTGACAGGGLGLVLACDVIVAARSARFVPAFTAIGLAPDCGTSAALAFAVGGARALRLLMTDAAFTAEQAHDWGMVATVADSDVEGAAVALATGLASRPTSALVTTRRLVRRNVDMATVLAAEYRGQRELARTTEHSAAVRAFLTPSRQPPASAV